MANNGRDVRRARQDDFYDADNSQYFSTDILKMAADGLTKFNGCDKTYSVSHWINDIEDNASIFGWTPTQQLLMARRTLYGTAALWLKAERPFKTWDDLKTAIAKEFPDTVDIKTIHEMMSARKKNPTESCLDYMFTMKELGKRGKMPDYVAIKYIVDGIIDREINKVMLYGVNTYSDFKEKLKIYETVKEKMTYHRPAYQNQGKLLNRDVVSTSLRTLCFNCGDNKHVREECPNKYRGKKCFNCNEFGHIAPDCPARMRTFGTTGMTTRYTQRSGTSWRDEPSTMSNGRLKNADSQRKQALVTTSTADGATATMIRKERKNDDRIDNVQIVQTIDGDSRNQHCHCGCHGNDIEVLEMKNCEKNKTHGKPIKSVKFNCGKVSSALIDSGSEVNLVSCDYFAELGLSHCDVNNNIVLSGLGQTKISSLGQFVTTIEIDNCEYPNVKFYTVPKNTIPYKVILGHDFLKNVVTVMKDGSVWMKPSYNWINEIECFTCVYDSLGYIKDEVIKSEVVNLVENYQPRQTKTVPLELKIILRDEVPISQRPRRISLKEQQEVDEQIQEWLEQGIIRVSFSEYSSPIVLVRKKNGMLRVCVDYRLLNKKILKDEYPLPIIDQHIDKLAAARVFSTIDLKNGFFHLKVHEDSIKYTSFVTMTGQYEFLRAPFGLSTCPKVFSRYISIIFRDLISKGIVLVFIDDLLIPAMNELQALERLQEVLKTASEYGLLINWEKTQLLVRRVEYLGYVIEKGSVAPSPGKTDAVMKFPVPKDEKQLHSFLGLCSYFRKFIENYAEIAQPLTDLLRKDNKFLFGDEHHYAYDLLKRKLASKPVLRIYEPSAETELHTDASSIAYAAILLQKDDNGELHPVHYMSRRTTDAESRYSSYELEALAIIEGIKKFRHYLYGKKFKIVTDCKAFQMTLMKKDMIMSTKVARWILFLQDYDFTIEHREGSKMRHVDALSRNPHVNIIFKDLHSDIRRAQESDDGLQAIIKLLSNQQPYKDFYLHGDILCKGPEQCLVIPQKMEMEIIRRAHGNGHFAKKKTIESISKDYYIPKLNKKVEDFIVTCIPCLLASRKEGKQEGFLNPIEKGDIPLQTLHIDHIGPLSETRKQYNHILTIVDGFTKFVWLFPTKSTSTQEVLNKLMIHQQTFGNPNRFISDRGTAFTSNDFAQYCQEEGIEHIKITTGVPRGNGQVERIHRTLISVLTKLSIENPTHWYKLVSRVQQALNSTHHRSIDTTPFQLLVGVKMKRKEDIELLELLRQEEKDNFTEDRETLRMNAKKQILDIQEENRRSFDKKRKESRNYKKGDLVCIKKTQFGTCTKLKAKFMGPYKITKVKRNNRYDVEKADLQAEGPNRTTTSSDCMKSWPDYVSDSE